MTEQQYRTTQPVTPRDMNHPVTAAPGGWTRRLHLAARTDHQRGCWVTWNPHGMRTPTNLRAVSEPGAIRLWGCDVTPPTDAGCCCDGYCDGYVR